MEDINPDCLLLMYDLLDSRDKRNLVYVLNSNWLYQYYIEEKEEKMLKTNIKMIFNILEKDMLKETILDIIDLNIINEIDKDG